MKKIIHYAFKRTITPNIQQIVYTCNWAVGISEDKITSEKNKVTCKNCLRIIKKWRFQDDTLSKTQGVQQQNKGDEE